MRFPEIHVRVNQITKEIDTLINTKIPENKVMRDAAAEDGDFRENSNLAFLESESIRLHKNLNTLIADKESLISNIGVLENYKSSGYISIGSKVKILNMNNSEIIDLVIVPSALINFDSNPIHIDVDSRLAILLEGRESGEVIHDIDTRYNILNVE